MVHDVTNPPFLGRRLEPAFLLIKLKRPLREKKKSTKPKYVFYTLPLCIKFNRVAVAFIINITLKLIKGYMN